MKTLSHLNRTMLAMACTALTLGTAPLEADNRPPAEVAPIRANAGVTAVLTPTSDPTVFTAAVTGVVQSSLLGSCIENAELQVRFPTTPGQPVNLNGTVTLTALDGANSLKLNVSGTALPDAANPVFYNSKYQVTFMGGTGAYASAKGLGEIDEVVMFTSPLTGTAVWTLKGLVINPR